MVGGWVGRTLAAGFVVVLHHIGRLGLFNPGHAVALLDQERSEFPVYREVGGWVDGGMDG